MTPKREAVQTAVLAATEDLLAEGASFADLNIEKIATRAGISRTAFYFYFKDKRELLVKLTEEVTTDLYEQADVWFSGQGEPKAEIQEALSRVGQLYAEHAPLMRAIVEVSTYDEGVAVFWRGLLERFIDATAVRITAERADGHPSVGDPQAIAFALVWMCERTLYQQVVQQQRFEADVLAGALVSIFMASIYSAS
jgi:AcrR family transcriptional regulator